MQNISKLKVSTYMQHTRTALEGPWVKWSGVLCSSTISLECSNMSPVLSSNVSFYWATCCCWPPTRTTSCSNGFLTYIKMVFFHHVSTFHHHFNVYYACLDSVWGLRRGSVILPQAPEVSSRLWARYWTQSAIVFKCVWHVLLLK